MIHRMRRREPADRRQHAERIAREENDVVRMTRYTGDLRVLNELDGIRSTSVFRDARVGIINVAISSEHDVLEDSAEAKRLKDVRLVFWCEIDRFRVAAAFDVEDAVISPNMFVVADKMTFRIGRQRRFSCAAETEKQRGHARLFICCR